MVDGSTVTTPLLDGLAAGTVGVPVILQTMAAEDDIAPDPTKADWGPEDFENFIADRYKPWGAEVVAALTRLYVPIANSLGGSAAYYALMADVAVGCGNAELAAAAASAGCGHVYLSQVVQPPGGRMGFPMKPRDESHYPFHSW